MPLREDKSFHNLSQTLTSYQQARRPAGIAMAAATDNLNKIFGSNLKSLKIARQLGVKALNHAPTLKEKIARKAMGL
jgi:2-octaprenyl-6-methoxyphenol hydroxylase